MAGSRTYWGTITSWANRREALHPAFKDSSGLMQRWAAPANSSQQERAARTLAPDAYAALWLTRHGPTASCWLRRRASSRRW